MAGSLDPGCHPEPSAVFAPSPSQPLGTTEGVTALCLPVIPWTVLRAVLSGDQDDRVDHGKPY